MFRRILIANRGEIALRVLRAAKELGIETVAVYSEADRNALHLRYADETVCIGPAASNRSYLDIPSLIAAVEIADVEAVHPGYGFLSEDAHFVEVCQSCNIKFIGPTPETIALVGDKVAAVELAQSANVPTVPGSGGPVESETDALAVAHRIGYPVLLKAAAGGGGRGMRVATNDPSPDQRLSLCPQRGRGCVWQLDSLHRKVRRAPAARRDSDPRRTSTAT